MMATYVACLAICFAQPPRHRQLFIEVGKISVYFVHAGLMAILMFLTFQTLGGHLLQTICPTHTVGTATLINMCSRCQPAPR